LRVCLSSGQARERTVTEGLAEDRVKLMGFIGYCRPKN